MKSTVSNIAIALCLTGAFAATTNPRVTPPALCGQAAYNNTLDLNGTVTNSSSIVSTVAIVDQKSGAGGDNSRPGNPPADTSVTAIDGELTAAGSFRHRHAPPRSVKRELSTFTQIFAGTGTGPNDRDAAIEGTAYLSYTLVPNATYDISACLYYCDGTEGCVFANLFYEYNNPLLDFVFDEKSNLKCALYGDIHTATEKTNKGGEQFEAPPAGLTYIQQSSGYSLVSAIAEPIAPEGYNPVFGPIDGANDAPGYMGFAFIDKYDVQACADLCNAREADANGGACEYFNIWRALVKGVPTTYTCSMYFLPTDASTATNFGQGDLQVTFSRGYERINLISDGGFEEFPCTSPFCFGTSDGAWTGVSPSGGNLDASIFFFAPYAHSGHGSGLLGSAYGTDSLSGTLALNDPLATIAGKTYTISFFHNSGFSGSALESLAFVQVLWNGEVVGEVKSDRAELGWTFHELTAVATGSDRLAFHGGTAPAWSFLDDVFVALA